MFYFKIKYVLKSLIIKKYRIHEKRGENSKNIIITISKTKTTIETHTIIIEPGVLASHAKALACESRPRELSESIF